MTYEKVGEDLPPLWEPKEGDSIEGIYRGAQHNVGKNKSEMYTIEVKGELMNFWGSTVLDGKMMHVKVGDKTQVTYEGKNKDPEYKKYTVEVDKPEEEVTEEEIQDDSGDIEEGDEDKDPEESKDTE